MGGREDEFLETINESKINKTTTYIYFFFSRKHYRHIARNHFYFLCLIHLRTRVRQVDVNIRYENTKFIDLKQKEEDKQHTPVHDLFQLRFLLHLTDTLFIEEMKSNLHKRRNKKKKKKKKKGTQERMRRRKNSFFLQNFSHAMNVYESQ
jgi:hypothetical protein